MREYRIVQGGVPPDNDGRYVEVPALDNVDLERADGMVAQMRAVAPAWLETWLESREIIVTPWERTVPSEIPDAPAVPARGFRGRCVRHGVRDREPVWFLMKGRWDPRCGEDHRKNDKPAVCFAPLMEGTG